MLKVTSDLLTAPPAACAEDLFVVVAPESAGERLDRVLAAGAEGLSRSRLKALIEGGRVTCDGATIVDVSHRVKPGERYRIDVPEVVPAAIEGQDIPLVVVYEDDHLLVLDKPAGLVVHPAPGNPDRTLVNALIAHCGHSLTGIGGERRPGLVHRLDKDTSGLMVVAKTAPVHASLVAQFAARSIERAYIALVWGAPRPASGRIEGNIGRSPRNRKKMAVLRHGGRPAATRYHVRHAIGSMVSLVECRLETGRTHQIRVHLADRGHPVVGDATYGRSRTGRLAGLPAAMQERLSGLERHALHAWLLGFVHPATNERLEFESKKPIIFNDLEDIFECL